MRTGTVKFSMSQKVTDSLDEETGKDIFVHASGINAEELREGDRVSYEEEEGKKESCCESSSYLFFYLRMFKRFEFFRRFFCLN
jgi:CspA family cold shock protein